MVDRVQLDIGDLVQRTAHDLAGIRGIDLPIAKPATVRLWQARALALHHFAAGDMDEALRQLIAYPKAEPQTAS